MKSYKQFITERVLSVGLNPKHANVLEPHRQEIHDILRTAYHPIGGYAGITSGSKEESDRIHYDLSKHIVKATRRNGKITSVNIYRDLHGRKSIASASDGTTQGKEDWIKNKEEDIKHQRAWGEVSGKVQHIMAKLGAPKISSKDAERLTGKTFSAHHPDGSYTRDLAGNHTLRRLLDFQKSLSSCFYLIFDIHPNLYIIATAVINRGNK